MYNLQIYDIENMSIFVMNINENGMQKPEKRFEYFKSFEPTIKAIITINIFQLFKPIIMNIVGCNKKNSCPNLYKGSINTINV